MTQSGQFLVQTQCMGGPCDAVEYRDIPGHPGYRAGSDGSIWSCLKAVGSRWHNDRRMAMSDRWKRLRGEPRKEDGRLRYTIRRTDGTYRRIYGSNFVLEAFVGPRPPGMEACHRDGNCRNDSSANLRCDTPTANKSDMLLHGTRLMGERAARSKLSDAQAAEVRRRRLDGDPIKSLALEFGVTESAISYNALNKRKVYGN